MVGRHAASKIASASTASFFDPRTKGFTKRGSTRRTSWPAAMKVRAQRCAVALASIAITVGPSRSTSDISLGHGRRDGRSPRRAHRRREHETTAFLHRSPVAASRSSSGSLMRPTLGAEREASIPQRAGADGHRTLQDRGDPPPRALAWPRGRRARHPRTEAPREATSGSTGSTTAVCSGPSDTSRPSRQRRASTSSSTEPQWPRRTQTKSPPGKMRRFNPA